MRKIILAALCAAGACSSAQAADWTKFVGSNPNFPNQLAEKGLAVDDTSGHVAVDAYNLANWSGQIEFVHNYTLDDTGTIPWIWGAVGRGASYAIVPHGVQLENGLRTTWIERQVPPYDLWNSATDEIGFANPNTSQPTYWHVEPRTNGRVVQFLSMGSQGVVLLRALDAGAGYEVVSLDGGGWQRWRSTVQPCDTGVDPSGLVLDYASSLPGTLQPVISAAGACANLSGTQVFAQRFDVDTGAAGAAQWIVPPPDRNLLRYVFSPAHELIAAYGTPWPMQEIWRIDPPNAPFPTPPAPVFNFTIEGFAPTSGNNLVATGHDSWSGEQVILSIAPGSTFVSPMAPGGLVPFGPGEWKLALDDQGKILAWRKETTGTTTLVRLVGLDSYGQIVDWTKTIDNVLAAAEPQVVPPRDVHHGFVIAVDTQDIDGTIGVHVERVGSTP